MEGLELGLSDGEAQGDIHVAWLGRELGLLLRGVLGLRLGGSSVIHFETQKDRSLDCCAPKCLDCGYAGSSVIHFKTKKDRSLGNQTEKH